MPHTTEINPADIADALHQVRDADSFLNRLLAETLNWPIGDGVRDPEEITYEWDQADLRARDLDTKLVEGQIRQLQLTHDQSWGIFILEFKYDGAFKADRGMTGILRQVLRGLVKNRNKTASLRSWPQENLLFICTHKYKHFRVAHFKAPKEEGRTARLAAFGWGPDIPARTACEFNLNHLGWPDQGKSDGAAGFDQWVEAFNVEKVTKKFYREYSDEFEKLRKQIKGLGSDTEDQKMFTQTLLNRLMFLRFIERKDWLTPPGGEDSKDYLRLLFAAGNYRGKSFYASRVRKLFFEGLAVDGKQESEAIGKAVFLNGGLFEENKLDEKVADIPNEAFAPLLGQDGLFYRYNFTVQESTPLDVEVAVDPEMLGKVFEELVTGRHESGSYYTPRPVVSFMCREALKGYLTDTAKLPEEAVAAFVDKHDTASIDIPAAGRLVHALDHLKAVDPACGSGAYLLGLLHEMVDLYRLLYSEKLNTDDRSLHDLKLRIISNSIYGVDIDKFATNIAMLRLWLSLSVDSKKPLPLPNLEFKIETGDSLLGPDPSAMPDLFREQLQRRADLLVKLKDKYLKTHNRTKHDQLEAIRKEERAIAKTMGEQVGEGIIDWRIQFAEVFAGAPAESTMEGFFPQMNKTPKAQMSFTVGEQRGGFDIVLANPPYVRQELIKELKTTLRQNFPEAYTSTADLYVYFYARAIQLLRPTGQVAFIAPNKFFRAGYGKGLRRLLSAQSILRTIVDFHDFPVFEATTYPSIICAEKKASPSDRQVAAYEWSDQDDLDYIRTIVAQNAFEMPQAAFSPEGWHLERQDRRHLFEKISERGTRLGSVFAKQPLYGIKTGLNEAFVIDTATRDSLVGDDPKSVEIIKPFLRGRDIKRWVPRTSSTYLIWAYIGIEIENYPAIKRHLDQYAPSLRKRQDQGNQWWELRPCSYYDEFQKPKIIYPDIFQHSSFAFDAIGQFVGNTSYFLPDADPALLGILNSRLIETYYARISNQIRGGYMRAFTQYMETLPIVEPTERLRQLVTQILSINQGLSTPDVIEKVERSIDMEVYQMYGLSDSEISLIESEFAASQTAVVQSEAKLKSYEESAFAD